MKTKYKKTILTSTLAILSLSNLLNAQSIAAGGWHSLSVCNDSTVKAFGENASGQLGDASSIDRSAPVTVIGLSGIVSVSGGGDQLEAHSLALKSNGTVWAWGSNIYGALGNGTTTNASTPVQVLVLSGTKAISAGGWHSTALKNDGTVWTWGWNTDGQLGDGTFVDKVVPIQVPGLTNVVKISAGTYHVLALKNDGTVWAWGDNVSGQIGDGSTTDRNTPVQVSGLTNVVSIAAGRFFSLAVKSDGTVWTWGENLYGQLGNGTLVNSSIPVQVSGLTGITSAVAATGAFHCMAVKSDNTVWSWGRNTYGNLGDGSVTNRSTPVLMTGVSDIAGLAAGTNFSLLYKNDGTFWGCGRNASGQLGDGTLLQRNLIVQSTALCTVLQPVGIHENREIGKIKLNVFPNPSITGIYNISLNKNNSSFSKIENASIKVINSLGEIVFQTKTEIMLNDTNLNIDLETFKNGIYYLSISSKDFTVNQILIKN